MRCSLDNLILLLCDTDLALPELAAEASSQELLHIAEK